MKIKSEDILKPGVKLETVIIDFNSEEVKKFLANSIKEQKKIGRMHPRNWTQKQWDMLNNVITI